MPVVVSYARYVRSGVQLHSRFLRTLNERPRSLTLSRCPADDRVWCIKVWARRVHLLSAVALPDVSLSVSPASALSHRMLDCSVGGRFVYFGWLVVRRYLLLFRIRRLMLPQGFGGFPSCCVTLNLFSTFRRVC